MPLRKGLIAAARMGASAVEIDARGELRPGELGQTGLRELRRLLEDHNLRVSAIGFQTRRGYDVTDEIERRVAATKTAMKFAADLRAAVVVNQVGQVPSEPEGRNWTLLVETLADLSRYGQHVGARLAAQTGTEDGADLARLIAALPAGGIGADLDPGNLIINGFSPLEAVSALGEHILHVHAHDGVRDLRAAAGWKCRWDAVRPISRRCSGRWKTTNTAGTLRSPGPMRKTRSTKSAKRSSTCGTCDAARPCCRATCRTKI